MKRSTKFFLITTIINALLSVLIVFTSYLRDVRVVDLVLFYATAFGAGASVAASISSLIKQKPLVEKEPQP